MGQHIRHPVALLAPDTRIRITDAERVKLKDDTDIDSPMVDGVFQRARALIGQTVSVVELAQKLFGAMCALIDDPFSMDRSVCRTFAQQGCLMVVCKHHLSQACEAIPDGTGQQRLQPVNAVTFGGVIFASNGVRLMDDLVITFEETLIIASS